MSFCLSSLWLNITKKRAKTAIRPSLSVEVLETRSLVQANLLHCKETIPKIRTNISKKELRGLSPISTFMCQWSAYSAAGKYVDGCWEYINRSQAYASGKWDWDHAIPFLGIYSVFTVHCSYLYKCTYGAIKLYYIYLCFVILISFHSIN
jgi:hypothetical protein